MTVSSQLDYRPSVPARDIKFSAAELAAGPLPECQDVLSRPIPEAMRALVLLREDEQRMRSLPEEKLHGFATLHYRDIPVPRPGVGEVLVAVMAASLNYNTLWSARHEPMSPFRYLGQFAQLEAGNERHNIDYQVIGSDACGVVVSVGDGVNNCRPGDRVVVHPGVVNSQSPMAHLDSMRDEHTRAWGFETNFGALAEYCLVRASQIMPKPAHLSWEEAASMPLINSTVYRMLVSANGAAMRLGESVLVWGGVGGLGSLAIQYVLRGGGHPIAVVSSPAKADLARALGCSAVIDRSAEGYQFVKDDGEPNLRDMLRFRKKIRSLNGGRDPEIVFEHTGRETFGVSVFVAAHGGRVVTCGSTSGFNHTYDNRYLWMHVKSIIGSHGANWQEAWQANDLVCRGYIHPTVSAVYPLKETHIGIERMRSNSHVGKIAVLCQATQPGLGIEEPTARARIGEDRLMMFR